jgi:beta-N-acetylhexosaminidase
MALRAGIDLVLVSHRLDRQRASIAAVRAAVTSGELESSRIREAARRVARVKRRRLARQPAASAALDEEVRAAHRALRDRAYAQSVTVIRDEPGLLPLRLAPDDELLVIGCPGRALSQAVDVPYADAVLVDTLRQRCERVRTITLRPDATEEELSAATPAARRAAVVLVVTLNLHRDERQQHAIRRVLDLALDGAGRVIGLAVCDPYDADALPDVRTWLATYEYSPQALETAARLLVGAIQPRGRSPVSLGLRTVEAPER